jgi:hypothetical protein
MSEDVLIKLMVLVERAVRPVRTNFSRKRQMREELLAHVTAIFEEEVEKSGDAGTALVRTRQRFGDPREISSELQRSVPVSNRIDGFLQGAARLKPGESLAHFAGKTFVAAVVAYLGLTACLVLQVVAVTGKLQLWVPHLGSSLVVAAFPVIAGFLLTLVAPVHSRALFGTRSERNLRLAIVCLAASLAFLPGTAWLTYFVLTQIAPDHDDIREFADVCWFSLVCAPMFPLFLVAGARTYANDFRDEREWARLEIES